MKNQKLMFLTATLFATNAFAQSETYNVEAGFMYLNQSVDDQSTAKYNFGAATYYLKPIVIDSTQPFYEAEFLQKASGVSIKYGNLSTETSVLSSTTVTPLEFYGKFYVDNFVFAIDRLTWGSTNFKLKSNSSYYYDIKSSTTGYDAGYYVMPNTTVSYTYAKSNATYTASTGLTSISDLNITSNGIKSHSVMSLGGTESLVLDFKYDQIKTVQTTSQSNTELSGAVRYYPQAKYFYEGGYKSNTGNYAYDKGTTLSAGAGYSFNPRFAVLLSTEKFNGSDSTKNSGYTLTSVAAGYRF